MKKILLAIVVISCFFACKKDDDNSSDTPLYVDFTPYKYSGASLPASVSFKANVPDGADQIVWDFGDSTTATGDSVTHIYNHYGAFNVTATAGKGSLSGTKTKLIPVTFYKKISISAIDILEYPLFDPNNITWDPGNDKADITCKITFPDFSTFTSTNILENSDSGGVIGIPLKNTDVLYGDIKVEMLERDSIPVFDYDIMGAGTFNVAALLNGTTIPPGSILINENRVKMMVYVNWIQ